MEFEHLWSGQQRGGGCHSTDRGFTLLELIIVIGIFVVMSGMLLANFRRSRHGDVVRVAALRLASDVQRMQALALSGSAELAGAVAYGVHVDIGNSRQYILFGDLVRCAPDAQGQGVCAANGAYDAGTDPSELLHGGEVALAAGVHLGRLTPDENAVDVIFRPPRGAVSITPEAIEARIVFAHDATSDTRTVTVNRISGRVNTE